MRGAYEESDLLGMEVSEALARDVDQFLPQLARDALRGALRGEILPARFVEDVEARAAGAMAGHDGVAEATLRLGGDDLSDIAQHLVEERPSVFGFDRFDLLDVDVDDADLALLDQDLFHAIEHDRQRRQRGGAIEEQRLEDVASRQRRFAFAFRAALQHVRDALEHFVAIERLDQIVVRADLQTGETVLHVAASGDQDDADVRGALHRFEGLTDFPAAAPRHHHVEQHGIGEA